jgi:hypothetical protein
VAPPINLNKVAQLHIEEVKWLVPERCHGLQAELRVNLQVHQQGHEPKLTVRQHALASLLPALLVVGMKRAPQV